ncbi:hypothetical protein DYB35_005836 [Aphanomyces astaci]|uniref:Uncharacterized protein n=1 Tax=Aphanomyces astaci TaxID=112090 RepID=A0A3R7AKZ7_APHAT|nr:hypothetical protein DYB35_005836 [Aphanomyces astaci]
MSRLEALESVAGFVYLVFTVVWGGMYVIMLEPSLANDMWWPHFNSTGPQTYLGDLCSRHLANAPNHVAFDLFSKHNAILKDYSPAATTMELSAVYPRMLMMQSTTDLPDVIAGMHLTSLTNNVRMYTQYCWADFDKRFELAHTALRQARCLKNDWDNAAVHLEAMLRNVEWSAMVNTFGGIDGVFDVVIASGVREFPGGAAWLVSVQNAFVDIPTEVTYWLSKGVPRWQLLWHNAWQPGVDETITVANALGMQQNVAVKKMPYLHRGSAWTSIALYYGFWNELNYGYLAKYSLVRGSSTRLAVNDSKFQGYGVASPTTASAAWQSLFGPYGSIDTKYVDVPPALLTAVTGVRDAWTLLLLADPSLLPPASALSTYVVNPVPPSWRQPPNFVFVGGNPMCISAKPQVVPQESFGFYDVCMPKSVALSVTLTPFSAAFALLGLGMLTRDQLPATVYAVCSLCDATAGACRDALRDASALYHALNTLYPDLVDVVRTAADDVANISLVQVGLNTSNQTTTILRQPLVQANDLWTFFGWVQLYDWVHQAREVVRFEGDKGTATVMSRSYDSQSFAPNSLEIPQSAGLYFKYLTTYITVVFGLVAAIMVAYGAGTSFHVLGRNLFRFNRVVGSVWVGRIFLFVRGMTAVVLLSTSNIYFVTDHGFASLQWAPYTFVEAVVISGEATWVVYVLQDFLVAFVDDYSYYAAPASSSLAWGLVFVQEIVSPNKASMNVERQCTTLIMAKQIVCNSGHITLGQFHRVTTILAIQGGCTLGVYVMAWMWRWKRHVPPVMTLFISGPAESYLDFVSHSGPHDIVDKADEEGGLTSFDKVSCIMCGLLTFRVGRTPFVFDLKAWMLIRQRKSEVATSNKHVCAFRGPSMIDLRPSSSPPPTSVWNALDKLHRVVAFAGLMYMVSSLAGSIVYIASTERNMANDFWWANFNASGAHAYLGNWFSKQLIFHPHNFTGVLDDVKHSDYIRYNTTSTFISVSPLYAKLVQYHEVNSIEHAIHGLRIMDACDVPSIMTQYCWLDLKRQFPMANSGARQRRCDAYKRNGAVYLESALRNIPWESAITCWWASSFDIAIGNDLRQSAHGMAWLDAVKSARTTFTLHDEAALWRSVGIEHYTTQYQNFKKLGVVERFHIQNAFGIAYPLTIQASKPVYQMGMETSLKLYWTLAKDLAAVTSASSPIVGTSLLTSSANFSFMNTSLETVLTSALVLSQPLDSTLAAFRRAVGPFGSIDAIHIPCPAALAQLYQFASEATAVVIANDDGAQRAFSNFPQATTWLACPPEWLNVSRYPGTVMCPKSTSTSSAAILSLWVDGGCSSLTESVYPTPMTSVVATLAANSTDVNRTCQSDMRTPATCRKLLTQVAQFQALYWNHNGDVLGGIATWARQAKASVAALNVSFLQFKAPEGAILTLGLFDNPSFEFFAWGYAFEWLMGTREVVSFEGDNGKLVLLSSISVMLSSPPNPLEIPANVALYFRGTVVYITAMLAFVAALATAFIMASGGHIEGLNMLEMNRVGGIVWSGRPLLFLRSIVAICLLSTAPLELTQQGALGAMTMFTSNQLTWYKLVLAAGEVGWFVFVVTDVLIIFTQAYTTTYAVMCGLLVWLVAVIFTMAMPVAHSVSVHRTCIILTMDFQSECTAGTVYVGSVGRFTQLVVMSLASMALCYAVERLRRPRLKDTRRHMSMLLSTSSRYLFALDKWQYNNCYYLDKASAVITGVLCVERRGQFYVLDIKLWRLFVLQVPAEYRPPPDHPMHERSYFAFPLIGTGIDRDSNDVLSRVGR